MASAAVDVNNHSYSSSSLATCSLSFPTPRSPPKYPDLSGKRRELAKVEVLERQIGFLEEELRSCEGLQLASRSCKEVDDFVTTNPDPFISINKKIRRSRRFWKWLCGKSCFSLSWICCCTGCSLQLETLNCCTCCSSENWQCCCWPRCCSCRCLQKTSCRCSIPAAPSCLSCSSSRRCTWPCSVAEEVDSLKESLDKHLLRIQKRTMEQNERNDLLRRANGDSSHVLRIFDEESQAIQSAKNSSMMLEEAYSTGVAILSKYAEQRDRLKRAQRKALDILNTVGLSNSVLKLVERRHRVDKWIAYTGMAVTVFVVYTFWKWTH